VTEKSLAHSKRADIPAQEYREHIQNVRRNAVDNARRATDFYAADRGAFLDWVDAAALYHDLGKLDAANQDVLERDSGEALPIAHEDAGVAQLERLGRRESVVLAAAHHAGLFSRENECAKQGRPFRRLEVADRVDQRLDDYLATHRLARCGVLSDAEAGELHACGFTRRVALSCLVDADHGDTARHYRGEVETPPAEPRWSERLAALEQYVHGLPQGKSGPQAERNRLRQRLYEACRDADIEPRMRACDAPVGTGKTTAVMAHLLRVAQAKSLRHIFVVLPYTTIITQSVLVYRRALLLDGEQPEDVVAEHHHQADFADLELRQLATLWKAPIIVTTAVQFFETLASYHPARLRKLHELPGSAVFVDEAHAAIPSHMWAQVWRWLETWRRSWGGHVVLGSGSLPRFWELDEYRELIRCDSEEPMPKVPDLVSDKSLRSALQRQEVRRLTYRRRDNQPALDLDGLVRFVVEKPGPRLLIANTVQTAAVIASEMRRREHDVLHLSTALAPAHRELVVGRVKRRLREGIEDWSLVATSCVEAGLDFSFRAGFRERASAASLIQTGGRVNRGNERGDAEVWDLLLRDAQFSANPALTVPRQALDRIDESELNGLHPGEVASRAMRREWTAGSDERARRIVEDEANMEYPSVALQCRVIADHTRTVIIDPALAQSIRNRRCISKTDLMRYSVQIWVNRIDQLALDPLFPQRGDQADGTLYVWKYAYDPDFLGYMAGVLQIERFLSEGGAII
jgi:CRISPR-associated endonuclease/helicase Cas3